MSNQELLLKEFMAESEKLIEDLISSINKEEKVLDGLHHSLEIFKRLKSSAGLFGLKYLESHLAYLKKLLETQKSKTGLSKEKKAFLHKELLNAKLILEGKFPDINRITKDKFSALGYEIFNKTLNSSEAKSDSGDDKNLEKQNNKGTVFIVDDEEEILDALDDLVSSEGHKTYIFNNAKELLVTLKEVSPDVILSDISMPGMNGVEMVKNVRALDRHVPVIFISAYMNKEHLLDAIKYGAYSFIEKPFEGVKVLNSVQNALIKGRSFKLIDKSIQQLLYQFSDLNSHLEKSGKVETQKIIRAELQEILEQKKLLKKTA